MNELNSLINAIEEVYISLKHYSRVIYPLKDEENLIPYIEEYYGLEYIYEKAYDVFMENPCVATYVIVNDEEEELWDYIDNILQPKISERPKRNYTNMDSIAYLEV
jgi:hypothetical protein